MNVYVRELCAALARSGVRCEVFTRAEDPAVPAIVSVEPGFRVHHVPAGPIAPLPKEALPDLVDEWVDGVAARLLNLAAAGRRVEAIHANYWLSGIAGHRLKHQLDVPLVSTFHTLDRVKAELSPEAISAEEPARRAKAEAEIMGCSDAILASCTVEAHQLVELYGAPAERVRLVAPAVDHAFFAPGNRRQARRAIGMDPDAPLVLFVGRIQPLKGLSMAVAALGEARAAHPQGRTAQASLVVVGGPSGPHGEEELERAERLIAEHGLGSRVHRRPAQSHEWLSSYYRAADVCVVPSRSESFGLVALEAGACGRPVLASAVGGLTTIIDDGATGYLLDPLDADTWAHHLGRLLEDPVGAERMGSSAAVAAAQYTWRNAGADLRRWCDELIAREPVACR
jgi:D-inositol-3-phosphate glycosyltransferase